MSRTSMRVDARGRIVLPADLRRRRNWSEGTTLVCVESDRGVVVYGRGELERLVRAQLVGSDAVSDLIEERRLAASHEDAN